MYAVFSFILTAVLTFGVLIFIRAEFFALLILIIYIGVITVLFLCVVLMYNLRHINLTRSLTFLLHPLFFLLQIKIYWLYKVCMLCLYPSLKQKQIVITENFHTVDVVYFIDLFNEHLFGFFLTGILILLALLGSIVITFPFYQTNDK